MGSGGADVYDIADIVLYPGDPRAHRVLEPPGTRTNTCPMVFGMRFDSIDPPILTGPVIGLGLAKVPQEFVPGCYARFLTGLELSVGYRTAVPGSVSLRDLVGVLIIF